MATKKSAAKTEETKSRILELLNTEKVEALTKKIWLAGLGAYGRSFDEVQERFDKANSDRKKFFDELVERGEKLQAVTEDRIKEGRSDLESRFDKLKGFAKSPSSVSEQLDAVNSKLDALSKDVKKIA